MNRTPRDEARSRRYRRGAWLTALLLATTASACKKEKKDDPLGVPPPRGAASTDELSTSLGQARALNTGLVPTTTRWLRTFVLDDKRAVLIGEVVNETIALTTENAGRTWQALRLERDGWSTWSLGADGSAAVVLGTPVAAKPSNDPRAAAAAAAAATSTSSAAAATEEPVRIAFAAFAAPQLTALAPVIIPKRKPKAQHPVDLFPAVLGPDRAVLVMEEAPRRWMLAYGGLAGAEEAAPLKLPPTEQAVTTPYGRPPMLLSARGRDLLIRPIPAPQEPLATPQKVPGVVATPPLLTQLSTAPACDMGAWSFQLLVQPKPMVLAVSKDKTTLFPLPAKPTRNTFGCVGNQLVIGIEDPSPLDPSDPTADPKKRVSTLALCTLEGQCSVPQKPPFRPWVEPHERTMMAAPTKQGAVAVLTSRSPTRWGLYLSQSVDGGKLYEVPRVIGEGMGDRGRIEIGAVLSFNNRILLLLEADVTGTSRRGWYVTASDDGGLTWGVP
ncbi:hypothetical protein [Chondromyces apiculatus]|uniref:Uncharacterized protein n=1 Tax=Chondromyces apiculatus DSM 436 TaxID=1192034 RepID=A0A017TCZ1_9BACT|nr:hypothetical protein [Chondromyces apiculatus]EYF06685.1 Hypothetical protein CAP_1815 [Chondromyces apiculatus DSM 436]